MTKNDRKHKQGGENTLKNKLDKKKQQTKHSDFQLVI